MSRGRNAFDVVAAPATVTTIVDAPRGGLPALNPAETIVFITPPGGYADPEGVRLIDRMQPEDRVDAVLSESRGVPMLVVSSDIQLIGILSAFDLH
jgi:hypothetical protein